MTVAKNIKHLRQDYHWTQEQLAEKIHTTRQTISNYETGKSEPDLETLQSLANAFMCDVSVLIYGPKKEYNAKDIKIGIIQLIISIVLIIIIKVFTLDNDQLYVLSSPYDLANYLVFYFILTPLIFIYFGFFLGRLMHLASRKSRNDQIDWIIHWVSLSIPIIYIVVSIIYILISLHHWMNESLDVINLPVELIIHKTLVSILFYGISLICGIGFGFTTLQKPTNKRWIVTISACVLTSICLCMSFMPVLYKRQETNAGALYSTRNKPLNVKEYTYENGTWEVKQFAINTSTWRNQANYIQMYYAYQAYADSTTLYVDSSTFEYSPLKKDGKEKQMYWKNMIWLTSEQQLLAVNDNKLLSSTYKTLIKSNIEGLRFLTIQYN